MMNILWIGLPPSPLHEKKYRFWIFCLAYNSNLLFKSKCSTLFGQYSNQFLEKDCKGGKVKYLVDGRSLPLSWAGHWTVEEEPRLSAQQCILGKHIPTKIDDNLLENFQGGGGGVISVVNCTTMHLLWDHPPAGGAAPGGGIVEAFAGAILYFLPFSSFSSFGTVRCS